MLKKYNKLKEVSIYFLAILICLFILSFVMKLWNANLAIPFSYGGDALSVSLIVKTIIETGWYQNNSFVGAPFGLDFHDYTLGADNLNMILIKVISLFSHNYAVVLNSFYLLTFPITTFITLYVLRNFKIPLSTSIIGSLLFAFLPYHFYRGENHFFLSCYYMIPLVIMMVLWIPTNKLIIQKELVYKLDSKKMIYCTVICLLVSSTGIYYAFFACFFLFIIGIYSTLSFKNKKHLIVSLCLIGVIIVGVLINTSSSIIYKLNHGSNNQVSHRIPLETEMYGLKIDQLLMPISGHRESHLANLRNKYDSSSPLVNENSNASLGFIGALGFMILILFLFKNGRETENQTGFILKNLSILNIFSLLLATIGGFSYFFAILVTPDIRAYNRISVYIGFISLFSFFLVFEWLLSKIKKKRIYFVRYVLLTLILMIGIYDQTSARFAPNYNATKAEFLNDNRFISMLEDSVPKDSNIFQLPYMAFPESFPINKMTDYELFKGYLHSHNLHWSYGPMRGREGDLWQSNISKKPIGEMIKDLAYAGFSGIYINRLGYTDNAIDIETKISNILAIKPVVSDNGILSFFKLEEYKKDLRERYTNSQWDTKKENALHPILLNWGKGFSIYEGNEENNWRWISGTGELEFINSSKNTQQVIINMSFVTGYEDKSNLLISSSLFTENLKINNNPTIFTKTIIIPPGKHIIRFTSDAKRVIAPNDPRDLVFMVRNMNVSFINS